MSERASRRRRRGNPYAGLIHLLNQRYHAEWQRAELLQNELTGRENSTVARAAEFVRRLVRRFVPHPALVPQVVTAKAGPYRGPGLPVPDATVSIVIPFRDRPELLRNCLRSLRRSTYRKVEIVLVDNGSEDPRTARLLASIGAKRNVRLVRCDEPFNFSRLCNLGAKKASGDHLLFLNNDTEVLTRRWLERMLALAADPAVGAVGATLLYPDRTIQHAGLFPRSDGAWVHPYRGEPADTPGENGELRVVRNVPAVTGACLLMRRDVFESVGGFDEGLQNSLNDADLCRRISATGRAVVITPRAKLLHYEGLSRGLEVDPLMALGRGSSPMRLSLIVPTRGRPGPLARMLSSVAATAHHPERLEVVLVIDSDDPSSRATHPRLDIRHVVVEPGRTMGALNTAGYEASRGDFVMLLNDDVTARTPGWDALALGCLARFPDPFALVHVNDALMRDNLCVFPLVSRLFCELAGGMCPAAYRRYRIDDHIEDVFNLLAVTGERRIVYMPDVVFEHDNAVHHPTAGPVYMSDPAVLALDAPTFDALFIERKELALRVRAAIEGRPNPAAEREWRAKLDAVGHSFDVRTPGRQLVVRSPWWRPVCERARAVAALVGRARQKSARGFLHALRKRLRRPALTPGAQAE